MIEEELAFLEKRLVELENLVDDLLYRINILEKNIG